MREFSIRQLSLLPVSELISDSIHEFRKHYKKKLKEEGKDICKWDENYPDGMCEKQRSGTKRYCYEHQKRRKLNNDLKRKADGKQTSKPVKS